MNYIGNVEFRTAKSAGYLGNAGLFSAGAVPSAYWDEGRGILDLNFGRAGQNRLSGGFFLDSGNSWDERPEQARGFTFITQGLAREICNRVVPFDYESGGGAMGSGVGYVFSLNNKTLYYSRRFEPYIGTHELISATNPGLEPAEAVEVCGNYPNLFIGFFFDG
jgi:hypothetical protein